MGDRATERRKFCPERFDVDELVVVRRVGELVDTRLCNFQPPG